jgi:hypothetical protein
LFRDVENEIYLLKKFSVTIFIKSLCLSVKPYLHGKEVIIAFSASGIIDHHYGNYEPKIFENTV